MPSLDAAFCKLKSYDMTHKSDFTPDQSVKSVLFSPSPHSRELTVITPPWHAPEWFLRRQMSKENKLGRSALCLTLDDNMLSADAQRTLDSFAFVATKYKEEIGNVGQEPTHWLATSLGTSTLMHAIGSQGLPAPDLRFIVPGGDLAKSLWYGLRTQYLRRQFEADGMTLPALTEAWQPLSPMYQAQNVQNAQVHMTISHADQVIPPSTAFEFANTLETHKNNVAITANNALGHYGTILASAR